MGEVKMIMLEVEMKMVMPMQMIIARCEERMNRCARRGGVGSG